MAVNHLSLILDHQFDAVPDLLSIGIFESVQEWVYDHSTLCKVANVSMGIFSIMAAVAAVPMALPALGIGGTVMMLASIVIGVWGNYIFPLPHAMSEHVFTPGECDGGRLYYEGDLPILSLDATRPFESGKAHGYLCGEAISRLSSRFVPFVNQSLSHLSSQEKRDLLARMRSETPPDYVREIQGVLAGYHQWREETSWWHFHPRLTLDDLLLLQLIPDTNALSLLAVSDQPVGCTSAVTTTDPRGVVLARNLDWPSIGLAGTYSIIVHRNAHGRQRSTVEVSVPSLVGTLTGMNDHGLSVSMNVSRHSPTCNEVGIPSMFINRMCLENCSTITEADEERVIPVSPYHLTVADASGGKCVHFRQDDGGGHTIRYPLRETGDLITFNGNYTTDFPEWDHIFEPRARVSDAYRQMRGDQDSFEGMLAQRGINNIHTMHTVVMCPSERRMQVVFDNAFAARNPLHEVPLDRIFAS